MMKMEQSKITLLDKIVSKQNIYNSIYCLESYVFDKGLLDTKVPVKGDSGEILAENDLELFYALGDKYNFKLIDKIIELCEQRLNWLFESKEHLFEM